MSTEPLGTAPRRARLASGGVVASWLRIATLAVVGIAQAPVLFGHVKQAELGVWYLLFAVATFVSLSDLGLPSTFGRAVSFAWGRETTSGGGSASAAGYAGYSVGQLYGSALASTAVVGLGFAAVAGPAANLYFRVALPDGAGGPLFLPLALFMAGTVANLIAAIPAACLSGFGDVAWDNAIRTTVAVAGFIAIWLVVPLHPGLAELCGIYAAQGLFALVATHAVLVRRHREVATWGFDLALALRLYRDSTSIFVTRIGIWLTAESTLLVAGWVNGPERLADFALLRQIITMGTAVATAIPIGVSPHAAAAYSAGDLGKLRSLYLAALRFTMIVNLLWTVGLLLWAPATLDALLGHGHFLGYATLVPLAAGSFLEIHASSHGFFVWSTGVWPFSRWVLASGALNVVLATLGARALGYPGLVLGCLVAQASTTAWVQVVHGLRRIGVTFLAYARDLLAPSLLYSVALGIAASALRAGFARFQPAIVPTASRVGAALWVVAGVAATAAVAFALAWFIALRPEDRAYFARIARLGR
jgi:hypothetical protein